MPFAPVQEAMIHIMVVVSASDRDMRDMELAKIGEIVRGLPVFNGFDPDEILFVAQACQRMLQSEDGFVKVLAAIEAAIPDGLRETAYAIAVETAVADLRVRPEELRVLQLLRQRLGIADDVATAVERAAVIRHRSIE